VKNSNKSVEIHPVWELCRCFWEALRSSDPPLKF
jgi:hypothetical protein